MKDLELRVLSELMKNSRRSDRELAKALGTSQPTVSRTIKKLEEQGIIKEYTMIPDFSKLGYEILGFTFVKMKEKLRREEEEEFQKFVSKFGKEHPHAELVALNGMGLNKDFVFVSFFKDYSAYTEIQRISREVPYSDVNEFESFLVNLRDRNLAKVFSMSAIAKDILIPKQKS